MLTAVHSGLRFKEELDGDGFLKKKKLTEKHNLKKGMDYIYKLGAMLGEIAPCLQASANYLPTTCFLLCMLNHYQHLFQWILKDVSGVWSSNHFPALHLNDRGEERSDCGSQRSW